MDKKPEILGRIINRINDEEGVRKLCLETFQNLWFMPLRESERTELDDKVGFVCILYKVSEFYLVQKRQPSAQIIEQDVLLQLLLYLKNLGYVINRCSISLPEG